MPQGHRGTTLLELLVAVPLFLAIALLLAFAFSSVGQLLTWVDARTQSATSAMLALDRLTRELRNSTLFSTTVTSGSSVTPSAVVAAPWNVDPPGTPMGTVLTFQIQDPGAFLSASTQTLFQPAPWFVVYLYDGGGRLIRKTYSAGQLPAVTPPPAFGTTCRLQPADAVGIAATTNGTEVVIAQRINTFTVTPAAYPTSSTMNGLTIQIGMQVTTNNQTVTQQAQMTVNPRN